MTPIQLRAKAEKERRERRDDTLGVLARDRDFCGWVEEAFGVTLSAGIQEMVESVARYRTTIVLSANSTGKTHGAARLAMALWKIYSDAQDVGSVEVYTAAAPPEDNLKNNLWGEINTATSDEAPDLFTEDRKTTMHLESAPKKYVTGVTIPSAGRDEDKQARFSGKHADALFFFVDEGDAVPEPVYDGIESCMSGGQMTRLLIMLNPRAPRGAVHRMVRNGEAHVVRLSALDHENVVQGEQVIPGAVDRETTVRRIAQWSRLVRDGEDTTGKTTFELPEYLVGCTAELDDGRTTDPLQSGTRVVTDARLCHMVLGVYPKAGANQLISREWIEQAQQRWHRYVDRHGETPTGGCIGYDVASEGGDDAVVCHRVGDFVRRFEPSMVWSGVDSPQGVQNVNDLYDRLQWRDGYVDETGVGDGDSKRIKGNGHRVMVGDAAPESDPDDDDSVNAYRLRDWLYWQVREWLKGEGAMLPPDDELEEELATPTFERHEKHGMQVMSKDDMKGELGRSPNKLDALALTFAPRERQVESDIFFA